MEEGIQCTGGKCRSTEEKGVPVDELKRNGKRLSGKYRKVGEQNLRQGQNELVVKGGISGRRNTLGV